jgi:hypothetical protein
VKGVRSALLMVVLYLGPRFKSTKLGLDIVRSRDR